MVIILFGISFFYKNYVAIDSKILSAFEKRDQTLLRNCFLNENNNWYQKTKSVEFYFSLSCDKEDLFLQKILKSPIHQNRLSLFEGCFTKKNNSYLIARGINDSYSYVRFINLKYMEKLSLSKDYQKDLKSIIKNDSSSMVKNQALKLILNIKKNE
ncbi:MAG: hypothetical protein COB02_00160 [Candidatus Cloacimonadota bacterium]|nr:MAG: hypothetical protein COB02_04295 [Candidatus Cloacimonadota bacterium]PCJ21036.1 MAG: hypothetical protein COB02_00160 [Candidatus Cloacimonadota bacterium]